MTRTLLLLALFSSSPALAQVSVQLNVPGVRVVAPPPPPRVEVQLARPSAGHVWVPGYWAWRGGRHTWVAGTWSLPPQSGYTWEPARWVNQSGRWVYFEGHWRQSTPPQPTYYEPPPVAQPVEVNVAPPAPIVETRPAMPYAGAVWIPGYWQWNGGRHVWVGGRWSAPRAGWRWEPAHWDRHGRHYRWVPGRWRH